MNKKFILSMLSVSLLVNLIGCSPKEIKETISGNISKEIKIEKPEEYIEKMYDKWINNEVSLGDIWEEYFSETSKNLSVLNKEDYIQRIESFDFKNNIKRKEIKVLSSEEIQEGIYKINIILKFDASENEMNEEITEYVIEENGEYKYLYDGIMSEFLFESTTIENIQYENIVINKNVEGMSIGLKVKNLSNNGVSFGWVKGSDFVVETDSGEFTSTLNTFKLDSGKDETINLKFIDAIGEIKSLKINEINFLNSRGLPENIQSGTIHTIEFN